MNFSKLTAYMDYLPTIGVPGCDIAVYQDHELIYRHFAGWRDEEKKEPMRGDETYCLYSCTKVFTSCAAMQLIEQGKMNLDDPVSAYLPAYAHLTVKDGDGVRPAKTVMTIRHLMSMQSGLNYEMLSERMRKAAGNDWNTATTRQFADAKALDPLEFDPGTDFMYSAAHDVLGAVIEVASGQKFSEYLQEHIFAPLGLRTITFQPNGEILVRQAAQFVYNPEKYAFEACGREDNHFRLTPCFESGGAGLMSDVRDYSLFADAIACGGKTKEGVSILSPAMIQLWSANQLGPKSRQSFNGWKRVGYSYGLGVRTRVDDSIGGLGSVGEFGWDGAAGAYTFIDPHKHLSAFYAMHVRNYGYSYDVIHPTLRSLIYEGLTL